jgi:uncharacterized protein (DUF305 family)
VNTKTLLPSVGRYVVLLAAVVLIPACGGGDSGESGSSDAKFDRAFIDAMIPHHELAIEMATTAQDAGLRHRGLIKMARDIARTQRHEINQMRAWREAWYGSRDVDPDGASDLGLTAEEMGMTIHSAHSIRSSEDVDTAFATAMIPHHRGAIRMARLAIRNAQHDELVRLSQRIIEAQSNEISALHRFSP